MSRFGRYMLYQLRSACRRVKRRFASTLDSSVSAMLVCNCKGLKGKVIQHIPAAPRLNILAWQIASLLCLSFRVKDQGIS